MLLNRKLQFAKTGLPRQAWDKVNSRHGIGIGSSGHLKNTFEKAGALFLQCPPLPQLSGYYARMMGTKNTLF
jgi:hypothetical protein